MAKRSRRKRYRLLFPPMHHRIAFVWDMDIHGFNIIKEEADSYYAGEKSIDEVMEIIKNRMELYLAEKE